MTAPPDHESEAPLLALSERLRAGDAAAAEELYRSYAPYLRMVVRRQLTPRLRARFDSVDVVQSVWAETLLRARGDGVAWNFRTRAGLRSFLLRLTRNRFIDLYRRHRSSLEREQPLATDDLGRIDDHRGDRPSEAVQAEELWELLLRLCPAAHRPLLCLRRKGATLAEIAGATGLHESSVRRILYELAARFGASTVAPPVVAPESATV